MDLLLFTCSFSLGCKAIFLLGGKSRDDDPLAMFLRSGDAVLMSGEARECFHGKRLANFLYRALRPSFRRFFSVSYTHLTLPTKRIV